MVACRISLTVGDDSRWRSEDPVEAASPSTSMMSEPAAISFFRFVARKCQYANLCRGGGVRAAFIGGAANQNSSFVSGERSKCFADTMGKAGWTTRTKKPTCIGGKLVDDWGNSQISCCGKHGPVTSVFMCMTLRRTVHNFDLSVLWHSKYVRISTGIKHH